MTPTRAADAVSAAPAVTVVGSINVDLMVWAERPPVAGELVFGRDFQLLLGGKGANVAAQLVRSGADTRFHACVGGDELGRMALDILTERGVDTTHIRRAEGHHTGVGHVHVDDAGEYRSIVVPGANAVDPAGGDELIAAASTTRAVVLQFETAAASRAALLAWAPRAVPVYLNPSPWTETTAEELRAADVLVCNELEARHCARVLVPEVAWAPIEQIGPVLAAEVEELVMTRGADGAVVWRRDGAHAEHPGYRVATVGTIGAGDAFLGEYVLARAEGVALSQALARACAAGALATTEPGPMATRAVRGEIDALVVTGRA